MVAALLRGSKRLSAAECSELSHVGFGFGRKLSIRLSGCWLSRFGCKGLHREVDLGALGFFSRLGSSAC